MTFNYNEAFKSSLKYFYGDDLAAQVFLSKYALKDRNGVLHELTPDDMHHRIAKEFARIEEKYPNPISEDEIYYLLKNFEYIIPAGSPMTGIGNEFQIVSLSNCFVISNPEDSYGSIMKIDEEQVHLMRRRGGVGHDLSHLRPNEAGTTCAANSSTGVVSFAKRYSSTTREVGQDGRRGALMLSLDVRHPDVERFIDSKMKEGEITGANISIKITDEFMHAVESGDKFILKFPVDSINPKYSREVDARQIWNKIIHNAWKSAEPGVLFWDKIINESNSNQYGKDWTEIATNPCGEIPLSPYDSCRLLSLNLYSYVINPFTAAAYFDFKLFNQHVIIAQRLMDDLVDLEIEKIDKILAKIETDPEEEETKFREKILWNKIRNTAVNGRRTGLGVTAEGDMIAAMMMKYGTPSATEFSTEVHKQLAVNSYQSSIILAKERGAFPICNVHTDSASVFMDRILHQLDYKYRMMYCEYGRRNISNLTVAPTGTVSIMTRTTSGIEPAFNLYYKRRVKINPDSTNVKVDFIDSTGDRWQEFKVFHQKFIEYCKIMYNVDPRDESEEKIKELIESSPYFDSTADKVDYIEKVRMQGQIQSWIDHSISVTINMPENATEKMVSDVYMMGWKEGCKGLTVYREGSRSGVLINNKETPKFDYRESIKRPKTLKCDIHHPSIRGEKYLILVGLLDDKPYEIFGMKNVSGILSQHKTGKIIKVKSGIYNLEVDNNGIIEDIVSFFERPEQEFATRMMSWGLSSQASVRKLVEQLEKSSFQSLVDFNKVMSRVLRKYIDRNGELTGEDCPNCKATLVFKEGCVVCPHCGYSKCG